MFGVLSSLCASAAGFALLLLRGSHIRLSVTVSISIYSSNLFYPDNHILIQTHSKNYIFYSPTPQFYALMSHFTSLCVFLKSLL